jgi:hypothetical protein
MSDMRVSQSAESGRNRLSVARIKSARASSCEVRDLMGQLKVRHIGGINSGG